MSRCVIAEVIGGAGTGKTTMMKDAVLKALQRPETGGDPLAIGFSSFTRAARREAASRVAGELGIDPSVLEGDGWFRTAHSVAYRQLGVSRGELLLGNAESDKWVSEALGSDVATMLDDEEEGGVRLYTGDPVAAAALNYWSFSRATLRPLREVVEADQIAEAPPADEVIRRIEMYESRKRLEFRSDFTDLLCRFAGVQCSPDGGADRVTPQGAVPDTVVGWVFDEAQDASALLDLACRRLATGDACQWVWLVGDPFQAIHAWAGADSKHFLSWGAKVRKVMPKSYRCPPAVMDLGERCLKTLPDYWDRGIAPADHDGEVVESENFEDELADVKPNEETLILARTNRNVRKIAAILDDIGIPFRKTKSVRDGALNRDVGMAALWRLQHGEHCTAEQWTQAMGLLPTRSIDGKRWLRHGAKAAWEKGLSKTFDTIYPEELSSVGGTDDLREAVANGKWPELVDGGQKWTLAATRWGISAVENPKVRIGTIHSVKGAEADNVIVLTSVGRMIREGEDGNPARFGEERRIEYVACTRARRRLVIAHDPRERYRMELPL